MRVPVVITGKIIKGLGQAKKLGFSTLNISPSRAPKTLAQGVYAAHVKTSAGNFFGVAYYGPRFSPVASRTNLAAMPVFEVHCFGISKMPPIKRLTLELVKRLRAPKKFKSTSVLKKQIMRDIAHAKKFLKKP